MKSDPNSPVQWKVVVAATACMTLAACGGGTSTGGGAIASVPAPPPSPPPPAPPPPPPPTPPTTSTNFQTAEFRRSDGASYHGALTAWQDGTTGAGSVIAIIDTGIDSDSPEFEGRIHPDSQDVVANRGIDGEDDHGTNIALVAAGARDNIGAVGIAFDAQILALRTDEVGSCSLASSGNSANDCLFADREIAKGIDLAVASGATVINISLGGGSANRSVLDAVARASDAGVVIVVSAGNGGDGSEPGIDPNQPDPFASDIQAAGNGNVIIVGSIDESGVISDFSNRPGDFADSYLHARGEGICCVYDNGVLQLESVNGSDFVTVFSGTSFAAPQVAGAVALLKQAFPNLTGQEIVEILLDSALDAGAVGADSIYGSGILDIASAFAPAGNTMIAGTSSRMALGDDMAIGSAAMGDALSRMRLSTIVTDKYDRAYSYDLTGKTRNSALSQRLRGAVERNGISIGGGSANLSMAFTVGEGSRGGGFGWAEQLQLSADEADRAKVLAARVAARIAPELSVGFALSQNVDGLVMHLQGSDRPAFAIAPQAFGDNGFFKSSDVAIAARREVGPWGITLSAEQGRAWLGANRQADELMPGIRERSPIRRFGLTADRSWGTIEAQLGLSWLSEESTVLGGYFHAGIGIAGADSVFADGSVRSELIDGFELGAAFRQGITVPNGQELLGDDSWLASQAWSVDLVHRNALASNDRLGLRVSQPLRVSGGSLALNLPIAYDYVTESAIPGEQVISLTPEGREIISEIAWRGPTGFGWSDVSLFYRSEPGHFANAPDDIGAVISFGASF